MTVELMQWLNLSVTGNQLSFKIFVLKFLDISAILPRCKQKDLNLFLVVWVRFSIFWLSWDTKQNKYDQNEAEVRSCRSFWSRDKLSIFINLKNISFSRQSWGYSRKKWGLASILVLQPQIVQVQEDVLKDMKFFRIVENK